MNAVWEQPPPPFLSRLDRPPVPRGYALLVLLVAAELARRFLALRTWTFMHFVVSGQPAASASGAAWHWSARSVIVEALLAAAIGALAGLAVRRAKWAVGAAVVPVVAGLYALWALSLHGRGVTVATTRTTAATVHFTLVLEAPRVAALLVVATCAGVGGAASKWVFRHVRPSAAMDAALAWIGVSILMGFSQQALFAWAYGRAFAEWSLTWLSIGISDGFPYLMGGLWARWALRAPRPWVPTLIVGTMALVAVLRGHVALFHGTRWSLLLRYASWCTTQFAWAAAGACLAGWWFRLTRKPERAPEAISVAVLVGLAVAMALLVRP
jgi:hypothetical protein